MGLFSKALTSAEHDKLISRIIDIEKKLILIEAKNESFEQIINSLRGLIYRKMKTQTRGDESDDKVDEEGSVTLSKEEAAALKEQLMAAGIRP